MIKEALEGQRELAPGQSLVFIVAKQADGQRLDLWLKSCMENKISRSEIQNWIKQRYIYSKQQKQLKSRQLVRMNEVYQVDVPQLKSVTMRIEAVAMDLKIVYEDTDLLVIHKPAGLLVHPALHQDPRTQISISHGLWALWEKRGLWKNLAKTDIRPGIVHRLDKDTEGLLVVAKHEQAKYSLIRLFALRQIRKEYMAWIWGSLYFGEGEGQIDLPISRHPIHRLKMQVQEEGRRAITKYKTLKVINTTKCRKFSQVELQPITGRTHQLRLHMAYYKCPVVGDSFYSHNTLKSRGFGLLLFARRLVFVQPLSKKKLDLCLDLPQRFIDFEKACLHFL